MIQKPMKERKRHLPYNLLELMQFIPNCTKANKIGDYWNCLADEDFTDKQVLDLQLRFGLNNVTRRMVAIHYTTLWK